MSRGRVLGLAVAGAALLLLAAGRPWAASTVHQRIGTSFVLERASRSGNAISGLGAAAGLVGLAGAAALLAVRGRGRMVAGAVLALSGAGAVAAAVSFLRSPGALSVTAWPLLSAAGGLLLAAGGLGAAAPSRRWPGLGRRFERASPGTAPRPRATGSGAPAAGAPTAGPGAPAAGPGADAPSPAAAGSGAPAALWDALDAGEDPTRAR